MNARLITTLLCPLLAVGCGHALMTPTLDDATRATEAAPETVPIALPDEARQSAPKSTLAAPGDFLVFRFSGSYRKAPVTMTERVVARRNDKLVIDVDISGDGHDDKLRLHIDDSAAHRGTLISVARRNQGALEPFGVARYGALVDRIMMSADSNDGVIDYTESTIHAGGHALPCTASSYKVHLGAQPAVLRTLSSDAFPWGHAGGEIRGLDGKLLYRAELIDMGGGSVDATVATAPEPDVYDNFDDLE